MLPESIVVTFTVRLGPVGIALALGLLAVVVAGTAARVLL